MFESFRLRVPSVLVIVCAFVAPSVVQAQSAVESGVKIPRDVPFVPDIKTPAPTPVNIERASLLSTIPERPADLQPAVANGLDSRKAPRAEPRASLARFERVHVAEHERGVIWARGRDYKVRFDASGATYAPFFGSRAPANHPLRFALTRARVGEVSLELDSDVEPTREGDGVAYARGALVERWHCDVGSVEQTFTFDESPGAGDLVLEIAVATDLVAVGATSNGVIHFENALGRVEYGAAVAIDADGRRFPMTSAWTHGAIQLRLDRGSLAGARFPLLVDPIVTTFAVDTSPGDTFGPDTAYEGSTDTYLVVEEFAYSATDHDVYAMHLDAAGNLIASAYIDVGFADWRRPRVASNLIAQNFLCVAAVTPVGGGQSTIRGANYGALTQVVGAQFTISGSESGDKRNPDVGGDPLAIGPTYYLVVWQRDFSTSDKDIHARRVGADGSVSATIFVDNSSNTIDTYPAISKSDGGAPFTSQNWTIVWQRFYFGVQEQVWGAQYTWDGSLTHATFPIDLGDECLRPTVSSLLDTGGFERTYMVAYQVKLQGQSQSDIIGAVFEGTQFLTGTNITNQVNLATTATDQIEACVDSDGRHFSVGWSQLYDAGTGDWDVYVADLVYSGGYPYLCEWDTFAYTSLRERSPRIASTYAGGGGRRRYVGAWDTLDQFTPGATRDVYAALWDGCEGGFARSYCSGDGSGGACPCGNFGAPGNGCASSVNPNGANLGWSGNPWIANDSFALLASGMPNSTSLYFQGSAPLGMSNGVVFGDGLRCVGGFVLRIGTKQNASGASQYPEAGDPLLSTIQIMPSSGIQLFYQVWYRNAAAYCTASTFNLTNGVNVIWGTAL